MLILQLSRRRKAEGKALSYLFLLVTLSGIIKYAFGMEERNKCGCTSPTYACTHTHTLPKRSLLPVYVHCCVVNELMYLHRANKSPLGRGADKKAFLGAGEGTCISCIYSSLQLLL